MAKQDITTEHYTNLLIDPTSGLTVAYSSEEAAREDLEFFQSHLNNPGMMVLQVPFHYDRMSEDLRLGTLTELKDF